MYKIARIHIPLTHTNELKYKLASERKKWSVDAKIMKYKVFIKI
jgi:hypothetical protein